MFQKMVREVADWLSSALFGNAERVIGAGEKQRTVIGTTMADTTLFQSARRVNGSELILADYWPFLVGDLDVDDKVLASLESALVLASLHAVIALPADSLFGVRFLSQVLQTAEGQEIAGKVVTAEVQSRYGTSRDGRFLKFAPADDLDWAEVGRVLAEYASVIEQVAGVTIPDGSPTAKGDIDTSALKGLKF